jgi:hypothetical protein
MPDSFAIALLGLGKAFSGLGVSRVLYNFMVGSDDFLRSGVVACRAWDGKGSGFLEDCSTGGSTPSGIIVRTFFSRLGQDSG